MVLRGLAGLTLVGLMGFTAGAQWPATSAPAADPVVAAGEKWIGRALILRALPAGGELTFDRAGKLENGGKTVDWTLAGMNVEKVLRRGNKEVELDGTRVAIRYNPDQHQFDRHPLKDAPIRVTLPASDAAGLNRTMAAIFATGIDPALERSLAPAWRHYFLPGAEWTGADALTGVTIAPVNAQPGNGTVFPVAEKKPEPDYTDQARTDRVKGTVGVRLVVDAEGVPRRVTIRQPLGYGLDTRTAEAVARWRFQPGTVAGKPVAMEVIVNQAFDLVAPPR